MAGQVTVIKIADLEPLIEALKFYASERSWEGPPRRRPSNVAAIKDGGARAREVLKKQPQARIIKEEQWLPI